MSEQDIRWLLIPDTINYFASNTGLIKSTNRSFITKTGKQDKRIGRTLAQSDNGKGYKTVNIVTFNGVVKTKYVHRLVAKAFIANPNNLTDVNHKDLNKANNRVENLEWVTKSQNSRHAYQNGAFPKQDKRGSKNGNNKLTEKDVIDIRKMKGNKLVKEIAKDYNISIFHVYNVFKGNNWKHLNTAL